MRRVGDKFVHNGVAFPRLHHTMSVPLWFWPGGWFDVKPWRPK